MVPTMVLYKVNNEENFIDDDTIGYLSKSINPIL